MIGNREMSMDDYLAMLRRRIKVILLPAILAPLAGFVVSFGFTPRYTSQAIVVVEGQKVPEGYVKPVTAEDVMQRVATIEQKVLTRKSLQPVVERLGSLARGATLDQMIEQIQQNVTIEPLVTDMSQAASSSARKKKKPAGQSSSDVQGFTLSYTANNANEAQRVCTDLTTLILNEDQDIREQMASGATDFLDRQLTQAKEELNEWDSKMANFKKEHLGQLPGNEDTNMKILASLSSQLDASNQALNRAEQDREYAKSLLAQQIAAWKASQSANNPITLQQQLASLQSQLITLQARYTDDHPDVVKAKKDIAELKRKLSEINSAAPEDNDASTRATATEPPEIQQLRKAIHQDDDAMAQATSDQKRLQKQIAVLEGRVNGSPNVEEEYNQLNRDHSTAQKQYEDLLEKKNDSEVHAALEIAQKGEKLTLVIPASQPDAPDFPNRPLFGAGGLGAGLAIGFGLAMWLELRDKSIRTEQDVLAVLELPMLASLPWIKPYVVETNGRGAGSNGKSPGEERKVAVEV